MQIRHTTCTTEVAKATNQFSLLKTAIHIRNTLLNTYTGYTYNDSHW